MIWIDRLPECVTWASRGADNVCIWFQWVAHWTSLPI
jgi:hypothetical protein